MPKLDEVLTDREGYTLEEFEPRVCPFCHDRITDARDWWDDRGCCLVCGFFTSAEERDAFNQKWGKYENIKRRR